MMAKIVYSIGSSNRAFVEFLAILRAYEIQIVADVRRFPVSRRFEYFSKENLEKSLKEAGLRYRSLGEALGGYRKGGYEAYMTMGAFAEGVDELERIAEEGRTAFMCAERLPWRCHRRFIGLELTRRGWEVVHIIDANRAWTPKAA
jgi:uncharacterized protein (DUF488 family)